MSLIKCSECGKDVSNKAASCPNCGNPLLANLATEQEKVITVQRTLKKWKKVKVYSWVAVFCGIMLMGGGQSNELLFWFGANVVAGGFIGLIVAKFGAWWSTG